MLSKIPGKRKNIIGLDRFRRQNSFAIKNPGKTSKDNSNCRITLVVAWPQGTGIVITTNKSTIFQFLMIVVFALLGL